MTKEELTIYRKVEGYFHKLSQEIWDYLYNKFKDYLVFGDQSEYVGYEYITGLNIKYFDSSDDDYIAYFDEIPPEYLYNESWKTFIDDWANKQKEKFNDTQSSEIVSSANRKFTGYFMDDNDEFTGETFIGWKARNIAVTIIVCDPVKEKVLLEVRGHGCPDNIGKLCCPCGYLNWNETLAEAVVRELYEETGFQIDISKVKMDYINDDPSSHLQNVTVRFIGEVSDDEILYAIENNIINTDTGSRGGENNEVDKFLWLDIQDIFSIYSQDDFAFNHYEMIKEHFKK